MKVAILADIHLSSYKREFDTLAQIKTALFEVANKLPNDIDMIIVAGDIFHDKTFVYKNAWEALLEWFEVLPNIEIVLLQGNHDIGRYGSLLKMLPETDKLRIVTDSPVTIDSIVLVPWSKHMLETLTTVDREDKILISHFGLYEAQLQSGLSFIDPIKVRDLKGFKLAILGHYHLPQELKGDPYVYYVGNIAPLDWNDKNQQKRFLILDTETYEVASVPIESTIQFYEFIDPEPDQLDEIQKLADQGHFVRVISSKPIEKKLTGCTVISSSSINVEDAKEYSSIGELARDYIKDRSDKDKLLVGLEKIEQRLRNVDA